MDPQAPPTGAERPLVLIHLSDIHLSERELHGSQDLDVDLRRKLLADLKDPALPVGQGVDGILVTGDISFAAKVSEFDSARAWLKKLCEQVRCHPSHVWAVPGNHDASWDAISQTTLDIHEIIRTANSADRLRDRLNDPTSASALLEPFANFNLFARHFASSTEAHAVWWESDVLRLNDGSVLRLRGLNSALVSDKRDQALGRPCQVVGQKQLHLSDDDDGVAYLTLCHHPPRWLLDEASAEDYLNTRARIQLYGHDHRHRARQVDNSLIVFAGALHPERDETEWEPRYNVMAVHVRSGHPRELVVRLFPRVWKKATVAFGADDPYQPFVLKLPPWQAPATTATDSPALPEAAEAPVAEATMAATLRDIVYDFFELPYPTRMSVVISLDLLREEDEGISDSDLVKRILRRATDNGSLDTLAEELRKAMTKK